MSSGFRLGCLFWVALVMIGSTNSELESLDVDVDDDLLALLQLDASPGTSELALEMEGMVDGEGKPVVVNGTDVAQYVPPKAASEEDIAALSGGKVAGDVDITTKKGPQKYHSIKYLWFAETSSGKEQLDAKSLEACQQLCTDGSEYKSFSYRNVQKKCFTSKEHMQYDLDVDFMVKVTPEMGGEPELTSVGPLKYTADAMSKITPIDKCGPRKEACTSKQCQDACATEPSCFSVVYRARDKMCLNSKLKIGYYDDSTYYEKSGVSRDIERKQPANHGLDQSSGPREDKAGDESKEQIGQVQTRAEVLEKAGLTPEQQSYVLQADRSPGDAKQQVMEKAILGFNREKWDKKETKAKAVQERANKAKKAALDKKAAESRFKDVEKRTLEQTTARLKEVMEGDTKAEERIAEGKFKGAGRAKEAKGKEVARLKNTGKCSASMKALGESQSKLFQLQQSRTSKCDQFTATIKSLGDAKTAFRKAEKTVSIVRSQKSAAATKIVFVEEKTAIKSAELKVDAASLKLNGGEDAGKQVSGIQAKLDATNKKIAEIKVQQPDADTKAGVASRAVETAKGALSAARLAKQSASTPSETTLTTAAISGALADQSKAESDYSAADKLSKSLALKLADQMKNMFSEESTKQGLEDLLAKHRSELSSAQESYLTNLAAQKLLLSTASNKLPQEQDTMHHWQVQSEKLMTLSDTQELVCDQTKNKVKWEQSVKVGFELKQSECSAERKLKDAAKMEFDKEFAATKKAFQLKMAQRKEADFIKMMAAAESEEASAESMEAKADAGSKVAELQGDKMEAMQQVQGLIPQVQQTEVDAAEGNAQVTAAKAAEQQAEHAEKQQEAVELKDAASVEAASPNNPEVVIKAANKLLETMREKIGIAEISAGERDTTQADEAEINGQPYTAPTSASAQPAGSSAQPAGSSTQPAGSSAQPAGSSAQPAGSSAQPARPISSSKDGALRQAETALASGDKTQAMAAIHAVEKDIAVEKTKKKSAQEDVTQETRLVIANVKKDARQNLLSTAASASKSTLQDEQRVARESEQKEIVTKGNMKKMQHQIMLAEHQAQVKKQQKRGIAGQWQFSGDAQDAQGNFGSATLQGASWEKDNTYGEYLSFGGGSSEANLGDLKFRTGTLALWVRVNKPVKQRLFGPGMEAEQVTADSVEDAVTSAVEQAVKNSLSTEPQEALIETGEGASSGEVSINADGSVSIWDGNRNLALSAQGAVAAGKWVSLAFAFSRGKSVTLYVNGALQHTVDCPNDFDGHPLILGRGLEGGIKNVDLWTRVLLRVEILHLNKPTTHGANVGRFQATSAEGKYELAKTKVEALDARLKANQVNMEAAENQVKLEEKDKAASEVRDKNEMKAAKTRREALALQAVTKEQAEKEIQKQTESNERESKSNESKDKTEEKDRETHSKDARKEQLVKANEKRKELARERDAKRAEAKDVRDAALKELKKKNFDRMTSEKAEKTQQALALEKSKMDLAAQKAAVDARRKEAMEENERRQALATAKLAAEAEQKKEAGQSEVNRAQVAQNAQRALANAAKIVQVVPEPLIPPVIG